MIRCEWQAMRSAFMQNDQAQEARQTCRCVSAAAAAIAAAAAGSRTGLPPSSSCRNVARGDRGGEPNAEGGLSGAGGTSTRGLCGCGAAPGLPEVTAPVGGCNEFSSAKRERPLLLLEGDDGSDAGRDTGPGTGCCCCCCCCCCCSAGIAAEAASAAEPAPCATEPLARGGSGGGRHWRSRTKAFSAHWSRATGAFRLRSSYSSTVPPGHRRSVILAGTSNEAFGIEIGGNSSGAAA